MVNCSQCGSQNRDGTNFCDNCGRPLPKQVRVSSKVFKYGVFYAGGHGDGYQTSFSLQSSIGAAMAWHKNAILHLSNPQSTNYFLGEVVEVALKTDDAPKIDQRLKVIEWYQLVWDGSDWKLGNLIDNGTQPTSIGLSNMEAG